MQVRFKNALLYTTVLSGLIALLAPSLALASATSVIKDCAQDGRLDGSHSLSDLQEALRKLPADVDQYTDCRSVIRRAANAAGGGSNSGSVANVSTASVDPTRADVKALKKAVKRGETPVEVGNEIVEPGEAGTLEQASSVPVLGRSFVHNLPTAVWGLVAALLLAAIALAGPPILRRIPRLRRLVARR